MKIIKGILGFIARIILVLVTVVLITTFVTQRTVVDGSSMESTYSDGDSLFINKLIMHVPALGSLERFDVVVFKPDLDGDKYYIKRIIGLPGDKVLIKEDGSIFVNGELLKEDYGLEPIYDAGRAASEIILGEDEYFVLGDNRNNSLDSRFAEVGNINVKQIIGRVFFT